MAANNNTYATLIDCIPAELRTRKQWVLWKLEERDGKQTKVPYQANGRRAESDNPATWTSLEKALTALPKFSGLGIMFADRLAGIDLDHHIDENGNISDFARSVVEKINSYTELSPSGTGLHVLVFGDLPEGRRKESKLGIEMYSVGRFFTFTGKHLTSSPFTVNERTAELAALHAEIFEQAEPKAQPKPAQPNSLDDRALLEKASKASNGAKFDSLYGGRWETYYGSQSEADLALCSQLVFWTGGDAGRVDRLFRSSGLMRSKWDERHNGNGTTYGQMTIARAMVGTDHYTPNNGAGQHETPNTPTVSDAKTESEDDNILLKAPADHDGQALCVLAMFPGKFLFVEAFGWLFYNGKCWQREGAESNLDRAIVETLKARRSLAAAQENYDLVKACKCTNGNVTGTKALLQSYVIALVDEFDNDPDQLNCGNGVLDLRTGKLTPHGPQQRYTYVLPVDYDPKANREEWLKFLRAALANPEMLDYLQVAIGYSLTGRTWEEIMFYLFGPPRSGKGTFTETILAMMGNQVATEADFSSFTAERNGDTQNFDLAPLKPCRFIAAAESNKNQPLNPAKIKALTGRNLVRCAFKHRDHFSYQPAFKIWLSSNHPVNVDVDDDAAWGRIRVIEFPNSHLGIEDKTLKARLSTPESLRGVLAWAVEGAQLWYTFMDAGQGGGGRGLPTPSSIQEATQQQRDRRDYVKQFIDECCTIDPEGFVKSASMYQAYKTWCEDNGVTPKLIGQLSQSLNAKGYRVDQKKVMGVNNRVVFGLKLKG